LCAHVHQAGEPAGARHCEIEQHQIGITATFEQFYKLVERPGFRDVSLLQQTRYRFAQRTAKQGMIVSDNESVLHDFSQTQQPFESIATAPQSSG
jgi:hypothetical protein